MLVLQLYHIIITKTFYTLWTIYSTKLNNSFAQKLQLLHLEEFNINFIVYNYIFSKIHLVQLSVKTLFWSGKFIVHELLP